MPSQFIVPIRFKTLSTPASVLVAVLPIVTALLPPQVIQVKASNAPAVPVNAPAIIVNSIPDAPKQPSAFQLISVAPSGSIGTYYAITINKVALPLPPLPLQAIRIIAFGGTGTYYPPVVNKLALKEPSLPPQVISTKPAGGIQTNTPVSVISFQAPTGVIGTTVTIPHTLGYLPQIVIAVMTGRTEAVDTVGEMDYQKSFGVAIQPPLQPVTQYSVGASSRDGTASSSARAAYRKSGLVCSIPSTGVTGNGILSMLSATANDITFSVIQQFTNPVRIQCMLFGGPDLTWIDLSNYAAPLVAGTQQIPDPGFKPDFLLFLGPHSGSSPGNNETENDSSVFFGVCDKNLNQWLWTGHCDDADSSSNGKVHSYMRSGKSLACVNSSGTGFATQGSVQSIDTNGFTINWDTINIDAGQTLGKQFVALAVAGGVWNVGNYLSQLDLLSHQVVNTLPQQPDGLILTSANKPESANLTLDNNEQLSFGLVQCSGLINYESYAGQKAPSWTTTVVYNAIQYDNSYLNINTSVAVIGKASVVSTQANGFTIQHSVADPAQNFIGYVAYSRTIPPGIRTTVIKTVKPNGGGDYLTLSDAFAGELVVHKNLPIENIILEFDCYKGFDTVPAVLPGNNNAGGRGYITSPSNYPFVKVIEHHVGLPDYSGNTYCRDINGGDGLLVQCEYGVFQGLQTKYTVADGVTVNVKRGPYRMVSTGLNPPTFWQWINCIADGVLLNGSLAHAFDPPSTPLDSPLCSAVWVNCAVYNWLSQDTIVSAFNTTKNSDSTDITPRYIYYNCGAYNCFQGWQDEKFCKQINCVGIGSNAGFNETKGPNAATDYNFSTCGPVTVGGVALTGTTLQGTNSGIDSRGPHSENGFAVYMQDPVNGDYRPLPGDIHSALIGKGVDLSTDSLFPFNYDIAGNIRTAPWTKGPFHVDSTLPLSQGVHWKWVGGVTDHSAIINVKLNLAETHVFLKIGSLPDLSDGSLIGPVATGANNVVSFQIGISPNSKQYYRVYIAGVPYGSIASFTGFPTVGKPASFVMACGGCTETGSNSNIFNAIKDKNPLLFLEYGDLHYWNIFANDLSLFRQALDSVGQTPKRANLYDSVARDYMWDDHDFGGNNVDGTNPSKVTAEASYRENVPSYTLPSAIGQIYHSFVIGRVRVIVTDLRSERSIDSAIDNSSKTMMGPEQLAWFYNELLTARNLSQFVFWFSTVPWIAPAKDNSSDNWGGFTTERRAISDFIELNQLNSMMLIFTGDMHAAAIDDGTHNVYTTDGLGNHIPVFNPFPLNQQNQLYGGVYTQGPVIHTRNKIMGFAGIITVTDDGTTLKVKVDIINELTTVLTFTKTYSYPFSPYITEHSVGTKYTSESAPAASTYVAEKPASTKYSSETPSATQFDIESPSDTQYTGE